MSDLFSDDRLIRSARKEIVIAREWLDRIERDLNQSDACVDAALLLYLIESFSKLSYTVGMFNKGRLVERDAHKQAS
jgi:hypothetical protein